MPVYIVAVVTANSGCADQLKTALVGLVTHSRTERGCLKYDLHVSGEDNSEFMFYEVWENQGDLDDHSNSPFMKQFGSKAKDWIAAVNMKQYSLIC